MKNKEKIFIFGDSYSTYEGYIPKGYECYYKPDRTDLPVIENSDDTWWKILSKKLRYDIVMNDSYSGSTVCTSVREEHPADAAFVKRADKYISSGYFKDNKIDTFFVFGGTNDSWINCPIGELKYSDQTEEDLKCVLPAFCYLIDRIKKINVNSKIVVIINTDLKAEITENFISACEHYSVDYVKLQDIDKINGHPTVLGMKQIAEQIENKILNTERKKVMKIPKIGGEWKVLFKPVIHGNYVNDHTVVMGPDNKWHLYGITSKERGPSCERYFVHGVGETLDTEFKEVGRSIDRGTLAWAPCVINKDENYYMFYGPSPTSLAVSFDMFEWFGTNVTLKNEPLMGAHRDHFVLKVSENEYLMYVVGVYNKKGAVTCFSSSDLLTWDFEGYALTSGDDAPLKPAWGAFESPYVVKKDGHYYLFITYTNSTKDNYNDTLVFCSDNPKSFGEYNGEVGGAIPVARLFAHAPEILVENGKYFITTCGWNGYGIPNEGAVSIAPLEWE